jgi:hypothetical protein
MKPWRCLRCSPVFLGLFTVCLLVGCGSSTQTAFDRLVQEKNTVNTQRDIMSGTNPICIVIHTRLGEWFFLSKSYAEMTGTVYFSTTTTLDLLLRLDPSIAILSDLPAGWKATRDSLAGHWERAVFKEDAP